MAVPTSVTAPVMSGRAQIGCYLQTHPGFWTGDPTSYGFQWQRDGEGNGIFASIAGETNHWYLPDSVNLVPNSSIEWTPVAGTIRLAGDKETGAVITSDHFDGAQAYQMTVTALGGIDQHNYAVWFGSGLSWISVTDEGAVTCSIYVKATAGKTVFIRGVRLRSVAGVLVTQYGFLNDDVVATVAATGAWQRLVITLPASTAAQKLKGPVRSLELRAGMAAAGVAVNDTLKVDAAQVEMGSSATAYQGSDVGNKIRCQVTATNASGTSGAQNTNATSNTVGGNPGGTPHMQAPWPQMLVMIDFQNDPLTFPPPTPVWQDVTKYVRGEMSISRGRTGNLDVVQAGQLQVTLDDSLRDFEPEYAGSSFSPYVLPKRRIRVQMVYGAGVIYNMFTGYIQNWPVNWEDVKRGSVQLQAVDGFDLFSGAQLKPSTLRIYQLTPLDWTGGTFKLTVGTATTGSLAYNASNATIQAALEALSTVGTGNVVVSGGPLPTASIMFTFSVGIPENEMTLVPDSTMLNFYAVRAKGRWTRGYYKLTVNTGDQNGNQTTGRIQWNATAGQVQAALEALVNVGAGHALVSGGPLAQGTPGRPNIFASPSGMLRPVNSDPLEMQVSFPGLASLPTLTAGPLVDGIDDGFGLIIDPQSGLVGVSSSIPKGLSGSQMPYLLRAGAWPGYTLGTDLIDPGVEQMVAIIVSSDAQQDLLQAIQQIASSERGLLFVNGSGQAVFHDRDHRIQNARSVSSQATFGDGGPATGEFPYVGSPSPDFSVDSVLNDVAVTPGFDGAVAKVSKDDASRVRYGTRSMSVSSNVQEDWQAQEQGDRIVIEYKDPHERFTQLSVEPLRYPTMWPTILAAEISDRHTVNRRPYIGGTMMSKPQIVESVQHSITFGPSGGQPRNWRTSYAYSLADVVTYWRFGSPPSNSLLDVNAIFR